MTVGQMIELLMDYPKDLEMVFDGGMFEDGRVMFLEVNEISPAFDDTIQQQVVLISDGFDVDEGDFSPEEFDNNEDWLEQEEEFLDGENFPVIVNLN